MTPELYLELNTIDNVGGKKYFKDVSGRHHDAQITSKDHDDEIKGQYGLLDDLTFGRCTARAVLDSRTDHYRDYYSDYLSVPSDDLTTNNVVTVGAWVYVPEEAIGSNFSLTFDLFRNSQLLCQMNFEVPSRRLPPAPLAAPPPPMAKLYVDGERDKPGVHRAITIPLSPPIVNTWCHLAGVIEGSKVTLYLHDLKGNRIGQPGNGIVENPVFARPGQLPGPVFNGLIIRSSPQLRLAHVRVYKSALTQAQIEADITSDMQSATLFKNQAIAPRRRQMAGPLIQLDPEGSPSVLSYNLPEPISYRGRYVIELDFPEAYFVTKSAEPPQAPPNTTSGSPPANAITGEGLPSDYARPPARQGYDEAKVKAAFKVGQETGYFDSSIFPNVPDGNDPQIRPGIQFALRDLTEEVVVTQMKAGNRLTVSRTSTGEYTYRFIAGPL